MERELEALRKEVQRMAKSPEMTGQDGLNMSSSPMSSPSGPQGKNGGGGEGRTTALDLGPPLASPESELGSPSSAFGHRVESEDYSSIDGELGAHVEAEKVSEGLTVNKVIANGVEANGAAASAKKDS